ncbi:MAG: hypothetical protein KUG78_09775 [Kangiellaceae bacterium]|nr:hypothetical protein [Kangiellaceae bacterium]
MNHQDIISKKIEFLNGNSEQNLSSEAMNILAQDETLANEIKFIEEIWSRPELDSNEQPSAQMQARFYQMLSHAQSADASNIKPKEKEIRQSLLVRLGLFQPAFQALLLVVVFGAGWLLNGEPQQQQNLQASKLEKQVETLNVIVALSMMKQDSAAERLVGVDYAREVGQSNEQLTNSLIGLLNSDRSSAVRLSVVDLLASQSAQDNMKDKIVDSLSRQENVLIQMALVELLQSSTALDDKQLKLIFSNKNLDTEVQDIINRSNGKNNNTI